MNHVTAILMGTVIGAALAWILAPYVWEPDVVSFGRAVIQGYAAVALPGTVWMIWSNYRYRAKRDSQ